VSKFQPSLSLSSDTCHQGNLGALGPTTIAGDQVNKLKAP